MTSVTESCCVLAVAFEYRIFRSYRMPIHSLFPWQALHATIQ